MYTKNQWIKIYYNKRHFFSLITINNNHFQAAALCRSPPHLKIYIYYYCFLSSALVNKLTPVTFLILSLHFNTYIFMSKKIYSFIFIDSLNDTVNIFLDIQVARLYLLVTTTLKSTGQFKLTAILSTHIFVIICI